MKNSIREQLTMLNNIEKKISSLYHELSVKLGISETALWVLYSLFDSEKIYTQNDFCEEWLYPRQTVNSAISNLVKLGYVTLTVIPGTRNSKAIELSESGIVFCAENIRPIHIAEERAFSQISCADRVKFVTTYEKQYTLLKKEIYTLYDEKSN